MCLLFYRFIFELEGKHRVALFLQREMKPFRQTTSVWMTRFSPAANTTSLNLNRASRLSLNSPSHDCLLLHMWTHQSETNMPTHTHTYTNWVFSQFPTVKKSTWLMCWRGVYIHVVRQLYDISLKWKPTAAKTRWSSASCSCSGSWLPSSTVRPQCVLASVWLLLRLNNLLKLRVFRNTAETDVFLHNTETNPQSGNFSKSLLVKAMELPVS